MPLDFSSGDLSNFVVPSHYHLELAPRGGVCPGRVEIDIDIQDGFSGHVIPIHAAPTVGIVRASLRYLELNKTLEACETVLDSVKSVQLLHFSSGEAQSLPLGSAKLSLDFVSVVQPQSEATSIYKIEMPGPNSGYATQFEPIGARSAFPCFDEPAIRTTFQLDLAVPKHQQAWSNTVVERKTEFESTHVFHFGRTMKMSCYLLAFVIGTLTTQSRDIEVTDGKETRTMTVSIVSSCADQSGYKQPLDWACNAVAYFTKAFECFLPTSKLDLMEIPLSGLGMENFGIATFRTGYLTIVESTTLALRKRICLLILHEISHMWFGDMVTVRWWSYLYLKEGFARLLEYTVATILYPEHCWWDHFLANHYGPSRKLDMAALKTHPVEMPIHRARDAEGIFDFISYAKGASVLRMSSDTLGHECFLAALPILINSHLYHSIETSDLWKCFQDAQEKSSVERSIPFNIDTLEPWVKRPGHPSIAFTTSHSDTPSQAGKRNLTIELTQALHCATGHEELFRVNHALAPYCQDAQGRVCYPIPSVEIKVFFADGSSTVVHKPLLGNTASFTFDDILPAEGEYTVLLNASHRGYFAVNYSEAQWDEILSLLERFSSTEILGLLIEMSQPTGPSFIPNDQNSRFSTLKSHAAALSNIDIDAYLNRISTV